MSTYNLFDSFFAASGQFKIDNHIESPLFHTALGFLEVERLNRGLHITFKDDTFQIEEVLSKTLSLIGELCSAGGISFHFTYGKWTVLFPDHINRCLKLSVSVMLGRVGSKVWFRGDEASVNHWHVRFKEILDYPGVLIKTYKNVTKGQNQQLEIATDLISKSDPLQAKQCFYPFMKINVDEYFKMFMESKSSILVLIGPPGTGKSTFLRTLILQQTQRALLAYSQEVIEHPNLLTAFLEDEQATVLGLEDSDLVLRDRENGNELMSTLLNETDGIVSSRRRTTKKIVFSTNLSSTSKIDPALLRRGRCFDIIEFRLLTVDEARVVEVEMGLPPQDFSSKANWSLSEILNPPEDFLQSNDRTRMNTGFVRNK